MKQNIARDAENYMKNHRKKGRWYKLVTGLACIVVFCTTYALILPAITLEGNQCGIEEHTHTDECYTQVTSITRKVPVCTVEGLDIHVHSEKCYDDQKNLICGYADFVAHKHDASCYREDGTLWCPLEEREPHVHDASCYTLPEPHVHTDECYTTERGELTCTEHVHTDECYTETTGLTCGLEESEAHHHDDSCHDAEGNLVCGQEESEGHHHSESCYGPVRTLNCGHEGDHQHTDACYEQKKVLTCELSTDPVTEPVLVCDKEEILLHPHTEECYDKDGKRICGQVEIKEHKHIDACFQAEEIPVDTEALTCTLPEGEDHQHTARCYGTWELTCGMEEHTHTLECYADPEADLETEADWEKTFASVTLTGKWREDLTALAETQLGYAESEHNYIVLEDGETTKGYTRYGAWQDDPYMDWNAAFVSFCLHYAGVTEFPTAADCESWPAALGEQYAPADTREPVPGDLVFFDQDSDGSADHVGILLEVTEGTEEAPAVLTTIEGDAENAVRKADYPSGDPTVLGYGILPEQASTFTLTATTESGITVTVSGDSASLPCLAGDVTVVVKELDEKERQEIEAQLAGNEEQKESEVRYLLDISLRRGENEIEPVGPVNVTFSDLDMEGPYSKVYHIDTEENVVTDMAAVKDEDGNISMETNHFSIYMLADEVTPEGTEIRTTGTLLSAISNSSGGKFYLGEDVSWSSQITISGNVTLDLNGYGVYYQGTGDFLVVNGGTLTIKDSNPASVSESNGSGNLYGNVASLESNDNKPVKLTYYVTESSANANGTGTSETLKKYEVTPKGYIVGEADGGAASIVKVNSGGTCNLEGGLLTIKNSSSYNGDAHIISNRGTLNLSGGYITGGKDSCWGGGIFSENGTVNMSGGVIADNYGTNGGGLCVKGGSFTMIGGVISGNGTHSANVATGYWDRGLGGGIFAQNATVRIEGGYITNNAEYGKCGQDGYGCHGGGGIATTGGSLTMTGGYVTGNYSQEAGGGMYVGHYNVGGTNFSMSGGIVAGNVAQQSEGGGIRIGGGTNGVINASGGKVYITNNHTNSTYDWGGGGIFVQEKGTLNIYNSLITSNSAGGFGGGVGACPTGETLIVHNDGAAIYGNTANGTTMSGGGNGKVYDIEAKNDSNFMYDNRFQDYFCVKAVNDGNYISLITGEMVGGGAANWKGSCDGRKIEISKTGHAAAKYRFGLTAYPDSSAISIAQAAAGVVISGNSAHTHGGGIMTNGGLILGRKETVITATPALHISGTKSLLKDGVSQSDGRDFEFQLKDSSGAVVGTATANASTGEFTISPNTKYSQAGTYTYNLSEVNDSRTGVTYDASEYTIQVTIAKEEVKLLGVTFTSYYVSSVNVTKTGGADTTEPTQPDTQPDTHPNTFRVHFKNSNNWEKVNLYIWDGNGVPNSNGWPGDQVAEDPAHPGWYTREFTVSGSGSFRCKFNCGDSYQKEFYISFSPGDDLWLYADGSSFTTAPSDWNGGSSGSNDGFTGTQNSDGSYSLEIHGNAFTNTITTITRMNLQIRKTDSNDADKVLKGATFSLKKPGEATGTEATTDENGIATFAGISRNTTYYLYETTPPANYMTAGPWILEVGESTATLYPATEGENGTLTKSSETGTALSVSGSVLSVSISDQPWGYELPNTGGAGTQMYTLGGLLLIATAGLLAYSRRKRRKEDFASF